MAPRAVWFVLLLASGALAGCFAPPAGGEQREAWLAERPPAREVGQAATFSFEGTPWLLTGDLHLTALTAPLTWRSDSRYLFFTEARLAGFAPGVLAVEGHNLSLDAGGVFALDVVEAEGGDPVRLLPDMSASRPSRFSLPFPANWTEARDDYRAGRFTESLVDRVRLGGVERAVLLREDETLELDDLGVFSASGWISTGAWIEPGRHDLPLRMTSDRYALGGDLSGILHLEGQTVTDPAGVFGQFADLSMDRFRISAEQGTRATQVLTRSGLLFPAAVEAVPAERIVTVGKGDTDWLAVSYREAGFEGDAVLEDIVVSGTGGGMVRVPTEPEWLVEDLYQIVIDTAQDEPWATPFVAIPVAIASPWVLLAEFASCVVGPCPQAHPYPVWMPAADVGVFYVRVTGDRQPGEYPATLHLQGQNFDEVLVHFTVKVT